MSMNQDENQVRPDYPPPPMSPYPEYPAPRQDDVYASPPQEAAHAGPPRRPGFDFQDLFTRWRSVFYPPSVAAFDAQKPAADWGVILISLLLVGLVQGVFSYITGFEYHRSGTASPGFGTIIGGVIGAYIGFFIISGLIYLCARMFGGTGNFLEHAWLLSLILVPIWGASAVVSVIPILGGIVGFALWIYSIVLAIYATASAHRISLGSSTAAVLIPGAILAAIVFVLALVAAAFLVGLGIGTNLLPGR